MAVYSVVIDAGGRVLQWGESEYVPPEGGRALEVDGDAYAAFVAVADALAAGEEVAYDDRAGTFSRRARAKSQAEQDEDTTRALVVQAAGSAVGVNLTALTAVQQRALLAVLLWKAGAVNPDGTIRQLSAWAR
jgi:hypothetical protein